MDTNADETAEDDVEDVLILPTRPPSPTDQHLRQKWAESVAEQSGLMDKLAQQLLTVELAVPGLYAAVLKLTQGGDETVDVDKWLYATFGLWTAALFLTLIPMIPRSWNVNRRVVRGSTGEKDALSIEQFFRRSARYKRRFLIGAIACFWGGLLCAIGVLF